MTTCTDTELAAQAAKQFDPDEIPADDAELVLKAINARDVDFQLLNEIADSRDRLEAVNRNQAADWWDKQIAQQLRDIAVCTALAEGAKVSDVAEVAQISTTEVREIKARSRH